MNLEQHFEPHAHIPLGFFFYLHCLIGFQKLLCCFQVHFQLGSLAPQCFQLLLQVTNINL